VISPPEVTKGSSDYNVAVLIDETQTDSSKGDDGEYIACLCLVEHGVLELIDSTCWRSPGGTPGILGATLAPGDHVVAYVASTGTCTTNVKLKISAERQMTVKKVDYNDDLFFEEGTSVIGVAYQAKRSYAVPAHFVGGVESPMKKQIGDDSQKAKQKKKLQAAVKDAYAEKSEEIDSGRSKMSSLDPTTLMQVAQVANTPMKIKRHDGVAVDDDQTHAEGAWQMDSAMAANTFKAMDVNGDGQVSLDEVVSFLVNAPPSDLPMPISFAKVGKEKILDQFESMDADNDGYLSFKELYGMDEEAADHGLTRGKSFLDNV